MKGAVAAGHPLTAQTGAEILAEGGNAVDACIAAAFVSWVAESPLTGPGAGGFMLVHRASDHTDRLLDFFVAIPGRELPRGGRARMEAVDVEFEPGMQQVFLIGAASCAVPGSVAGLGAAHAAYARIPWAELIAPAARLAREGLDVNTQQGFLQRILDPILRAEPEGKRIYGGKGPLQPGERLRMPALADTLDRLAAEGPDGFYRGDVGRAISAAVQERGGSLTQDRPRELSRDPPAARAGAVPPVGIRLQSAALGRRPPDCLRAERSRPARRSGRAGKRTGDRGAR